MGRLSLTVDPVSLLRPCWGLFPYERWRINSAAIGALADPD